MTRAPDSALRRLCRGPLRVGALGIVALLTLALTWLARRGSK